MPKAIWNGEVIAESNDVETVEGNLYFPKTAVASEFLKESAYETHCPWKGEASYYTIVVNGMNNENAAWYYPHPKKEAEHIKDHIAFWKGVQVQA